MIKSPRARLLLGFAVANGLILLLAAVLLIQRDEPLPLIQGVYLAEGRALQEFSLLDHHGEGFSREDLQGRWHLVSYGFTTCPDICPTTLTQLDQFLRDVGPYAEDLQVLFYSVDHRRDTVAQLATYVPYFNSAFIGLTHVDNPDNPHLPFESSLGITAKLEPGEADNDYQVLHGVHLFLLNPDGELQAIFEPRELNPGVYGFNPSQLVRDYRKIREYQANS